MKDFTNIPPDEESIYSKQEQERYEQIAEYERVLARRKEEEEELNYDTSLLDIRVLTFLHLGCYPDSTQGTLSRQYGTNPVGLSRVLNSPKHHIKGEWIPSIQQLLADADYDSFISGAEKILSHQKAIRQYQRRESVADIIYSHYNFQRIVDDDEPEGVYHAPFGSTGGLCFTNIPTSESWYFWDYDSSFEEYDEELTSNPFMLLDILAKKTSSVKTSIFTTNPDVFSSLISKLIVHLERNKPACLPHYRSIIFIDLNQSRIANEYILSPEPK